MRRAFPVVFLVLLMTCSIRESHESSRSYIESSPAFSDLRHGDWLKNEWIRKPQNLLIIHETFKKLGYKKLIPDHLLSAHPFILRDIYINRSAAHLLDSLELTYNQTEIKEKYYREFWQRRKAEMNDSVVYIIIKEINMALKHKPLITQYSPEKDAQLVNDTLLRLLQIEYRDNLTSDIALQDFETLRQLGFHHSAYNLLYERYEYQEILWNRDSLEGTLTPSDFFSYAWFDDNTK